MRKTTMTETTARGQSATVRERQDVRRVVTAGVIGQLVEYYDYGLYALLAVHIGRTFFPEASDGAQLLAAFAIFGVGFLARPLGGVILGPMGDRIGRRGVLIRSIIIMTICTVLVGLTPGAAVIGIAAPIIIVLLRLGQAFSAGGEFISAATYVNEHAPAGRRGLYSCLLQAGSAAAFLLGKLVVFVTESIAGADVMADWAWRIPFVLALPIGVIGVYVRLRLEESPVFENLRQTGNLARTPLRDSMRGSNRKVFFQTIGLSAFLFVSTYTFLAYLPSLLKADGYDAGDVVMLTVIANSANVVFFPLVGLLSERVGRKQTCVGGAVFVIVTSWPLLTLLGLNQVPLAVVCVIVMAFGVSLVVGPPAALFVEFIPAPVRMSTFGLAYNLGAAIFGGTAVYVAGFLREATGSPASPAYYLIAASLISLATLATIKDYRRVGESVQ
jgi:MHS family proline/betaine transporter-like MFS transporter